MATVHPYPTPPFYPTPGPAHPPRRCPFDLCCVTCARKLMLLVIVFFIFVAIILFLPTIFPVHTPEVSVCSAVVSSLNISSSFQLTADWDISIAVLNPNKKMSINYDTVRASVDYGSVALAETTLPPFSQCKGSNNLTTIRARFAATGNYIDDERTVKGLLADRALGAVDFGLSLSARVSCPAVGAWVDGQQMHFLCEHVIVVFTSVTGSGSMLGAPAECSDV